MRIVGIIPSRLASTRLPNKPLLDIAGHPMIWHVWNRAKQSALLSRVCVSTPDAEIAAVIEEAGGSVIITRADHPTGSDRLAETVHLLGLDDQDIVVNIQGDEPLIETEALDAVVRPLLEDPLLMMSSACCVCPNESLNNTAAVKVVLDRSSNALYFSRSLIPYTRNENIVQPKLHIGLYAYKASFLRIFTVLPPSPLEQTEGLEQLRALEYGYKIRMVELQHPSVGVDTQEDLERVRAILLA